MQDYAATLKDALLFRESSGDYSKVNTIGYAGGYQFGAAALETLGYLKKGSSGAGNKALDDPSNWTGKGGVYSKEEWLANKRVQDTAFEENTAFNLRVLKNRGTVTDDSSPQDVHGYLAAAHVLGAKKASQDLSATDAYGTSGKEYFELGVAAFSKVGGGSSATAGGISLARAGSSDNVDSFLATVQDTPQKPIPAALPAEQDSVQAFFGRSAAPSTKVAVSNAAFSMGSTNTAVGNAAYAMGAQAPISGEMVASGTVPAIGTPPPADFVETFRRSATSGAESLAADLSYFGAAIDSLQGDKQGVADSIKNARIQEDFAAIPMQGIQRFSEFLDEPTVEGFFEQVVSGTGQLSPSVVSTIAGAGVGSVAMNAGRIALSQVGKQAAKNLIKDSLEAVGKGTATAEQRAIAQAAYEATREARNIALKSGALGGAYASEFAPLSGGNVREALESGRELTPDQASRALAVATPQAAVGVFGEAGMVALLAKRAAAKSAGNNSVMGRLASELGKGFAKAGAIEGTAELIQEEIAIRNRRDMDKTFTDADANLRRLNAGFVGFFGGGAIGGAGSLGIQTVREIPEVTVKSAEMVDTLKGFMSRAESNNDIAGAAPDQTTTESEQDINAQLAAMVEGTSSKEAVWISGTTPASRFNIKTKNTLKKIKIAGKDGGFVDAYAAFVEGRGTIVSTDADIVDAVVGGQATDAVLAAALGYSGVKTPEDSQVVRVFDKDGGIVSEETTTPERLVTAQEAARALTPEGGRQETLPIDEALADRAKRAGPEIQFYGDDETASDGEVSNETANDGEVSNEEVGNREFEGETRTHTFTKGGEQQSAYQPVKGNNDFEGVDEARAAYAKMVLNTLGEEVDWSNPILASISKTTLETAVKLQDSNPDEVVTIEANTDLTFRIDIQSTPETEKIRVRDGKGKEELLSIEDFIKRTISKASSSLQKFRAFEIKTPEGKTLSINPVDLTNAGRRISEALTGTFTGGGSTQSSRVGLLAMLTELLDRGYEVSVKDVPINDILNNLENPRNTLDKSIANVVVGFGEGSKPLSLGFLLRPYVPGKANDKVKQLLENLRLLPATALVSLGRRLAASPLTKDIYIVDESKAPRSAGLERTNGLRKLHLDAIKRMVSADADSSGVRLQTLTTINGVGPRMAQIIVSGLDSASFDSAVINNDVEALTALPGVGKKIAERLIIGMRDKVGGYELFVNVLTPQEKIDLNVDELKDNTVDDEVALAEERENAPVLNPDEIAANNLKTRDGIPLTDLDRESGGDQRQTTGRGSAVQTGPAADHTKLNLSSSVTFPFGEVNDVVSGLVRRAASILKLKNPIALISLKGLEAKTRESLKSYITKQSSREGRIVIKALMGDKNSAPLNLGDFAAVTKFLSLAYNSGVLKEAISTHIDRDTELVEGLGDYDSYIGRSIVKRAAYEALAPFTSATFLAKEIAAFTIDGFSAGAQQSPGWHKAYNGGSVIVLDDLSIKNDAALALIASHELGHALFKEEINALMENKPLYARLVANFEKDMAEARASGNPITHWENVGFEEWYADQVSVWVRKDVAADKKGAANAVESHFKKVVRRFKKLYAELKRSNSKRAAWIVSRSAKQDESFAAYMRGVAKARRNNREIVTAPIYDADGELIGYGSALRSIREDGTSDQPEVTISRPQPTEASHEQKAVVTAIKAASEDAGHTLLINGRTVPLSMQSLKTAIAKWKTGFAERNPNALKITGLLLTADSTLRWAAGDVIADMFYIRSNAAGGFGFVQARQRARDKWRGGLFNILGVDWTTPEVQRALNEAQSGTPTENLTGKAKALRKHLEKMHKEYAEPSNSKIGFRKNYFPVLLDLMEIAADQEAFVDLVMLYSPDAKRADIENTVKGLGKLQAAIDAGQKGADLEIFDPVASVEAKMDLTKDIPPDELAREGFVQAPEVALLNYIDNLTKRVEWNTHTKDAGGKSLLYKELEALSPIRRETADAVLNAYLGNVTQLSPFWQKASSYVQAINLVTLLPFAVFASIPDFAGAIIQTKEFNGFQMVLKEIVSQTKDREAARRLAADIGVVMPEAAANAFMSQLDSDMLDPKVRMATDKFFKYTGLTGLTTISREFAAGMSKRFLIEHANYPTARSARYLEQLGVTGEQVKQWQEGGFVFEGEAGEAIKGAMARFVESSILRPNAAERPIWANDPRFALIWQLKSFIYAFNKVILQGIEREFMNRVMAGENMVAALAPLLIITMAAFMPLAAMGLELREYAKVGLSYAIPGIDGSFKYLRTDKMDYGTYFTELFSRAGLDGPMGFLTMAQRSGTYGGSALATLAGPTAELVEKTIRIGPLDAAGKRLDSPPEVTGAVLGAAAFARAVL